FVSRALLFSTCVDVRFSFVLYALMLRLPPSSPLFPYTTLFRSCRPAARRTWPCRRRRRTGRRRRRGAARSWSRPALVRGSPGRRDRKSTRLNSSHVSSSYAVFCLKKKIDLPLAHVTGRLYTGSR